MLSLPRVAPVVSGRLMIVGSERLELVLDLCDIWKEELDRELVLLRAGKDWRDRKAPRTRLLEALVEVFRMPKRYHFSLGGQEASLTLYHLSNSGNAPGIDLYTVPPVVHRFLARAGSAAYQAHWKALVQAFWFRKDNKREQPFEEADREVYERLSELPLEVDGFIRRIFLHYVLSRVGVRRKVHTIDIDQWLLVELFLKEIIGNVMHIDRIQMIRRLADELAREIHEQNDRWLYRQLMGLASGTDAYRAFRALLLRALRERLRRENQLFLCWTTIFFCLKKPKAFQAATGVLCAISSGFGCSKNSIIEAFPANPRAFRGRNKHRRIVGLIKKEGHMAFISGIQVLHAPASALNNAGTQPGQATENAVIVKALRIGGRAYPYVSAQAYRYWGDVRLRHCGQKGGP